MGTYKMLRPLSLLPLFMLLVLHQSPPTSATFAVALTAGEVATVTAVALLAKLGGLAAGAYLTSQANVRRSSRRGRRDTEQTPEVPSLELLPSLEVDDCYKRVICSASSGQIKDQKMTDILLMIQPRKEFQPPLSNKARKFVEAAQYGKITKSVAKCEHRYICSLPVELLEKLL